ncbi:MAG TPA: hypothetical protein VGK28_02490 [Candidatus Dormibacteraeota bacterium]|jgi:hypothetical protein
MKKSTIVRTWLGGLVALAAGLLVAGISIGLMLAYGGTFTQTSSTGAYDFVPTLDGFFWMTVGGIVTGCVFAAVGGLIQLVAWIGALINTFRVPDKTWFAVLLAGGILGLAFGLVGLASMVAYLIAGPDGMAFDAPAKPAAVQPTALAPTA